MVHITTKKQNKRGRYYNTRSTKNANGYSKHFAGQCPDKFLKLAVYGTFDSLARTRMDMCWISIPHPVDAGFTKRVRVLAKNKAKFQPYKYPNTSR